MSYGIPCIASNCSGSNELIDDGVNGELFKIGDVSALSQSMTKLLNNFEKRQSYSIEAQKKALLYSPEKIYPQWEKLLLDAASNKNYKFLKKTR